MPTHVLCFCLRAGGRYVMELMYGSCLFVLSCFVVLLTVLIVALMVTLLGRSMFWFTHFHTSILLYGSVAAGKILLIHTLAKNLYYRVSETRTARASILVLLPAFTSPFTSHCTLFLRNQSNNVLTCIYLFLPLRVCAGWIWATCSSTSVCYCGAAPLFFSLSVVCARHMFPCSWCFSLSPPSCCSPDTLRRKVRAVAPHIKTHTHNKLSGMRNVQTLEKAVMQILFCS